ncbi:MAG: ABC transporter permease, partial [Fimbriimonadales bacterium]|nr:ABC transporter permease [Fimbriimonadales bacterium]
MRLPRLPGTAWVLLAACAAASALNPRFLSVANWTDLLLGAAPTLIAACGLMLVIASGEIDISIGSLLGLCAAAMGTMASPDRLGLPPAWAALATLALGLSAGLINGMLVSLVRVPSIIVTLGMLSVLKGASELLMAGRWITRLPDGLRAWGTGSVLGVPTPIAVAMGVVGLTALLAHRTAWGRRVYAVGSSPESARLAGISVERTKLAAFAWAGLLVALAALVSVPRLSVVDSGIGVGFELLVVTCVVVGGVSIRGGTGTVSGVALGVLLRSSVRTVLI